MQLTEGKQTTYLAFSHIVTLLTPFAPNKQKL